MSKYINRKRFRKIENVFDIEFSVFYTQECKFVIRLSKKITIKQLKDEFY